MRLTCIPGHRCRIEPLEDRRLLAWGPELVADVNTAIVPCEVSDIVAAGDLAYFLADENPGDGWRESLWRTDGTALGTYPVKRTDQFGLWHLIAAGDRVYFTEQTDSGYVLWTSDGTLVGTRLLAHVGWPIFSGRFEAAAIDGILYFPGASSESGVELWRTDGTQAGTWLVKDLAPGLITDSETPLNSWPQNLTNVNGTLYFTAWNPDCGHEIWRSDGTESGTFVIDLAPGTESSDPSFLTNVNGTLLFWRDDGVHGFEPWKTDGTVEGSALVEDVAPGPAGSANGPNNSNPLQRGVVDGAVYFIADDGQGNYGLWKSDGNGLGTAFVRYLDPGYDPGQWPNDAARELLSRQGRLYFTLGGQSFPLQVWTSDGTEAGTLPVEERLAGSGVSQITATPVELGGTVYFSGWNAATGQELWKSDGTPGGTALVKDIRPGPIDSAPSHLAQVGNALYFTVYDPTVGTQLWKSDGSEQGTVLITALQMAVPRPTYGSDPTDFFAAGHTLYFTAKDQDHGRELWKSDGTASGTALVRDIWVGPGSGLGPYASTPQGFAAIGDQVFFVADDGIHGAELWRTDGTEAGTALVKDLWPGFSGPRIEELTAYNGALFFGASHFSDGRWNAALWRSDGTEQGTSVIKDGAANNLTIFDGALYFTAADGLWKTDGTEAGTVLVKAFAQGPGELTPVGDTLFFVGWDAEHGPEVWKSDGTAQGTTLVKDIYPGPPSFDLRFQPHSLTAAGGLLFFASGSPGAGIELWKSDGTEQGTTLVHDIAWEDWSSDPTELTSVDGTLYFTANDFIHGRELWTSDGTEAGTHLVFMVPPGLSLGAQLLTNVHGMLVFSREGQEWVADGSAPRTIPMPYHSPEFAAFQGALYMTNGDWPHGAELWKLAPLPGDTNYDGRVDLSDFGRVKAIFGRTGDNLPGELDYDGDVDLDDFGILKANFGVAGDLAVAAIRTPSSVQPQAAVDQAIAALGLAWHAADDPDEEELP